MSDRHFHRPFKQIGTYELDGTEWEVWECDCERLMIPRHKGRLASPMVELKLQRVYGWEPVK